MSEVHDTVHLKSKILVLYKYLNDEQNTFCLLQCFSDAAQNSLMIPYVFHISMNIRRKALQSHKS